MPSDDAIVHVIDDDEAVRESLAFLLQTAEARRADLRDRPPPSCDVAAEVKSGCIVTDVRMPEISGIDLLRRLKELKVAVPVIVITGHGDVPLAVEAMKIGAARLSRKAVRRRGPAVGGPLGAQPAGAATASARRNARRSRAGWRRCRTASARCSEGLVAGHPNKTIAFDLGISPRTVEIYRANLMTKMQAASLSDLVRMALVAGILDSTPDAPKAP